MPLLLTMENIHIGIIEDEPVVMESLSSAFAAQPSFRVHLRAGSVEQALALEVCSPLNLILLDIGLPGMTGLEGIRPLRAHFPNAEIVMLTTFEEPDKIFKALCNGAVAYLTKRTTLKDIVEAVQTVHQGGSYMSPSIARKVVEYFAPKPVNEAEENLSKRQLQIIQGIVDGLSYKMISDRLGISMDTVRDHIKKTYRKLEVNSKAELIKKSHEQGLLNF
jgi:DNA-binding NarL/FixJ family response regulator